MITSSLKNSFRIWLAAFGRTGRISKHFKKQFKSLQQAKKQKNLKASSGPIESTVWFMEPKVKANMWNSLQGHEIFFNL
jgi:hypothetical protein